MRLLLIDNFDSFVYNLAQAFGAMGVEPVVVRNDASLEQLADTDPDALVISPGPGTPRAAGISMEAIRHFGPSIPVLGVCLGHQCIAEVYGARVERAAVGPVHGKTSKVAHDGAGVFREIGPSFEATRYHSLAIVPETLPPDLRVSATAEDGTIMGVRHRELAIEGVQFHPESILCSEGPRLLSNFVASVPT